MDPHFFSPNDFRAWLEANHATSKEVLVGYYKKDTGRSRMTWPESVDQALCYGWIDGIRRSLGEHAYTIRFTPRKARSRWSAVNVRRMGELIAAGLVTAAGIAVFEARTAENVDGYSSQTRPQELPAQYEAKFRQAHAAWMFFEAQPLGYRRSMMNWIMDARREETRLRRLDQLIADSQVGERSAFLRPRRGAEAREDQS